MKPYFPKSHGVPRVDDLRVISGIIDVLKIGLQWRDAPREYCPHKTLYNRFIRWSEMGVFNKIFKSLFEAESVPDKTLYNRFIRWSEMGVFNKIFKSLFEAESVPDKTLYNRFIRWSEMGVFNKIFKSLKYSNLSLRLRVFQNNCKLMQHIQKHIEQHIEQQPFC